ncbi:hypothetical protein [Geofilum rubicundum]|uniref:Outer membrane protein beta-barrel domain-containing protein n=1 Tax=Geofilum rubicundum JCM 15548 TaxID=1236989 RepID=A0A0E9LXS0_9BACT|nr:hypothetical protein [Geofilum rubicundum]GAO30362.1 hypothetical protein JCM15548_12627 [Geofilum rubicundum JCM 15548]
MKRLLPIWLFFIALTATKAQDRIITVQKDTIDCRIISVGDERIIYEQETSEFQVVGKSIATSNVLHYLRLNQPGVDRDPYRAPFSLDRPERPYLLTIQGGMARLFTDFGSYKNTLVEMGVPTSEADDYIGQLKNGLHIHAAFHYLLSKNVGIGVDYSLFYSASEKNFLIPGYNQMSLPVFVHLSLDEKLYAHFSGLSLLFQQFPGSAGKLKISETLSSGLFLFRNEVRSSEYQTYWNEGAGYNIGYQQYYDQANAVTTGATVGIKGGLSVEYQISPGFSAGLAGNFIWAKLQKASYKDADNEINDQELETAIDVSHLDYGLTVRYSF